MVKVVIFAKLKIKLYFILLILARHCIEIWKNTQKYQNKKTLLSKV